MTSINNLTSTDELDPTDQFPLWSGVNGASRKIAYGDFLSELMKDANPMTTLGDVIFGIAKGVQARLPIGANGQVLGVVGGVPAWTAAGGGGGSVAGSDKQIQYNASGAFGAEAGFEYDYTSNTLTVQNATYTGLALTAASATGGAGFRLPHGAAPTSPTNGDVWTTTTGMYARINGVTVGPLSSGGSFTGGTLTSALNEAPQVTIASASTVNIGAAAANSITVTGTTTITAFDSIATGAKREVVFSGILTLTHNATSLILPTGASITTAAGDVADFVSLGSGNWRCVNYMRASGSALASSGGGLTNWTESANTAAPNATVPVVAFTVSNAATNVDAVIVPKGTGSVAAAIADSGPTGGNKRGSNAVDWQTVRGAATRVASGTRSTISGGNDNTAGGTDSTVGGGASNIASGNYSVIAGGQSNTASGANNAGIGGGTTNTASGDASRVGGGSNNTASGINSVVSGGLQNTASGDYSFIAGGYKATTRSIIGAGAHAAGTPFAGTLGEAQSQRHVQAMQTSNATPTVLASGASTASATNTAVLPNNSAYVFEALIVGKVSTFGDRGGFKINGLISRNANAAATQIDGTPIVTTIATVGGASAWAVAAQANTTNGALEIKVTGVAATTINWVAHITTVEVVG